MCALVCKCRVGVWVGKSGLLSVYSGNVFIMLLVKALVLEKEVEVECTFCEVDVELGPVLASMERPPPWPPSTLSS